MSQDFNVHCHSVGCKESATVICIDHHDIPCCDSCALILCSTGDTLPIASHKKLLKTSDILIKLIDHIEHRSQVYKMNEYYTDHTGELELISEKVRELDRQVIETVTSQAYRQYPYLMVKVRELKKMIDESMMYKNFCFFMQSRQFNDTVLYPQDQLAEHQKRQAMMYFDDLHDKMHTEMMKKKDEEVKA